MNLPHLLQQAEIWTDRHGVEHRLDEMEPRYCGNVAAFLLRQADQIAFHVALGLARCSLPDENTQAYLSVTASIDEETDRIMRDPSAWLLTTPLITALLKRAEQGD
ncbi:hypothetical protein [Streptomyces sp. NRRL S-337]|uniref:hypothetical protein n=1 Tax=Streptomyces sp. NRRL S-337 TaxID=1463900 RepID=UPI0004C4E5E6|nr:hypothetical protein [Streptomyces sp. NRRL S-337]